MVTPSYNPFDGRRRNGRSGSYPPGDRRNAGYPVYPDPRGFPFFTAEDDTPTQRKRIAVACGRCRKRKIRCSGDNGAGLPCTNCRNAGFEPCMYLRVASQETQMKQDTFSYNIEASRQYHSRGSASAPASTSASGLAPAPAQGNGFSEELPAVHEGLPYRPGPPPMAFNGRTFEPIHGWPTTLTVDPYSTYPTAYPVEHDVALAYRGNNNTAIASSSRESGGQPEHSYIYGSTHAASSLVHRPAPIHPVAAGPATLPATLPTDPTDDSFQAEHAPIAAHSEVSVDVITTPAAHSVSANASGERAVPTPVERHSSVNTSMATLYRNEAPSPAYRRATGALSPQSSTSGSGPLTPGSESSSPCYTSYETPAIPPSPLPFPVMALAPQMTRPTDVYGPSSSSNAPIYSPTAISSSARAPAVPDMTYRYMDTTVTDTGESLVGILPSITARRSPPSTEAAPALAHQHHHGNRIVGRSRHQQHTSYIPPDDGDATAAEPGPAEEERESAVTHP